MKKRSDVVAFVQAQLGTEHQCKFEKGDKAHYGVQELRELLDFIYDREPKNIKEKLHSPWFGKC